MLRLLGRTLRSLRRARSLPDAAACNRSPKSVRRQMALRDAHTKVGSEKSARAVRCTRVGCTDVHMCVEDCAHLGE
jgi:hypothetical protein